MFQCLTNCRVCMPGFKVGFLQSIFLVLLLSQSVGVKASTTPAPSWTVPSHLTSNDGHAYLDWKIADGQVSDFFKITELFNGQVLTHYTEATSLHAWRVEPGDYGFVLQSCVKTTADPDCSSPSAQLTLTVSEAVTATLLTDSADSPTSPVASSATEGGPDQMQPGHWYNPAKSGHGWSFYWANRLALAENDPLFGNTYDLIGIWYTFEAKLAISEPGCLTCPPDTSAYRPAVLKLKAVSTGADKYGGSLYASRSDGREVWVGSANINFGSGNTNATINWSANFKKESLSDSDPLTLLLGSDPANTSNISHNSGLWAKNGPAWPACRPSLPTSGANTPTMRSSWATWADCWHRRPTIR